MDESDESPRAYSFIDADRNDRPLLLKKVREHDDAHHPFDAHVSPNDIIRSKIVEERATRVPFLVLRGITIAPSIFHVGCETRRFFNSCYYPSFSFSEFK